ncbi:hypothetical protein FOZ62_019161, partial [Perkinsus olseni]
MCLRLRVAAALFGLELVVATLSTVRSETRKALTLDHRTYAVSTLYRKGKQAKQKTRTEFRKTQGDSLICRVRDINNDDSFELQKSKDRLSLTFLSQDGVVASGAADLFAGRLPSSIHQADVRTC